MLNHYIKHLNLIKYYLNRIIEYVKVRSLKLSYDFYQSLMPLRIFLFGLPFLSQYSILNLLTFSDISKLTDKSFNRIKYFKNRKELALKYIELVNTKIDTVQYLTKASWCIAFEPINDLLYEDFIALIKKIDLSSYQINKLAINLPNPFFLYGDMAKAEQLQFILKNIYDIKLDNKPCLFNEVNHFSALGHLTLTFFLLQAIHSGLIDPRKTPISLVFDSKEISNLEYANLISRLCSKYNVKLVKPSNDLITESNLELWPINHKNKYVIARHYHASVYQKSVYGQEPFLIEPLDYQIKTAEKIISKHFDLNTLKFVGIHFRTTNDGKDLRNPHWRSFQIAIDILRSKGIEVLLVGKKSNSQYSKLKSCFNTTNLKLSRYEIECINIYVWSKSKFFIGSLSGGTMPPMTFGTPTLWLDIHPTIHYRPPNPSDIYLPKRIYSNYLNRFITFEESHSVKHRASQTESPIVASLRGYKLHSPSKELIEKAVLDMLNLPKEDCLNDLLIKHPDPNDTKPFSAGARIYT